MTTKPHNPDNLDASTEPMSEPSEQRGSETKNCPHCGCDSLFSPYVGCPKCKAPLPSAGTDTETPTPRTDAYRKERHRVPWMDSFDDYGYPNYLPIDFARALERDLAEQEKRFEDLRQQRDSTAESRDSWMRRIRRLEGELAFVTANCERWVNSWKFDTARLTAERDAAVAATVSDGNRISHLQMQLTQSKAEVERLSRTPTEQPSGDQLRERSSG